MFGNVGIARGYFGSAPVGSVALEPVQFYGHRKRSLLRAKPSYFRSEVDRFTSSSKVTAPGLRCDWYRRLKFRYRISGISETCDHERAMKRAFRCTKHRRSQLKIAISANFDVTQHTFQHRMTFKISIERVITETNAFSTVRDGLVGMTSPVAR